MKISNYLTIDVEDYFQVSAFEDCVNKKGWNSYPSRVENNTERLLSLLERNEIKGTFFILGWTASKFPNLVKNIYRKGHEIACHSYFHRLVYNLSPEEFEEDTRKSKDTIEQITGQRVYGYRAPSYSITRQSLWAIDILKEIGFLYSSSVFPVYHDRYGIPGAPRFPFLWDNQGDHLQHLKVEKKPPHILLKELHAKSAFSEKRLLEIPISTSLKFNKNLPVSGGGYFRLFPYWFTRNALQQINKREKMPFIFYLHPWEIDPGQPRIKNAKLRSRLRHYLNLHRTYSRLEKLLQDFSFHPIFDKRSGAVDTVRATESSSKKK